MQEAQETFGVDFDYDEFSKYEQDDYEEEEEDDEEEDDYEEEDGERRWDCFLLYLFIQHRLVWIFGLEIVKKIFKKNVL